MLLSLIYAIKLLFVKSSGTLFVNYLRENGVQIGERVVFRSPRTTAIDVSRGCLVKIGNDVDINTYFSIMTHDFSNHVFRNYFHDYINNCGHVHIGNNVYIGTKVTILRGVTIGDNVIIGAGSIVTRDIPSNSVAVGVPCKVISSLEQYYEKRKSDSLVEAMEYFHEFRRVYGRYPSLQGFELREEWRFFVDKRNINEYPQIPIRQRVGIGYEDWLKNHVAPYQSYEEFISAVEQKYENS